MAMSFHFSRRRTLGWVLKWDSSPWHGTWQFLSGKGHSSSFQSWTGHHHRANIAVMPLQSPQVPLGPCSGIERLWVPSRHIHVPAVVTCSKSQFLVIPSSKHPFKFQFAPAMFNNLMCYQFPLLSWREWLMLCAHTMGTSMVHKQLKLGNSEL